MKLTQQEKMESRNYYVVEIKVNGNWEEKRAFGHFKNATISARRFIKRHSVRVINVQKRELWFNPESVISRQKRKGENNVR